ncbi:hypothetical protein MRX96_032009, partial [Rhipicephalus microplus]
CYQTYKGNCCCPAQIRRIYATSPEYPASAVWARERRGDAHICEDCLKCQRLKKGQRNQRDFDTVRQRCAPEQHLNIALAFTVLLDLQGKLLLPSPDKTDLRQEPRESCISCVCARRRGNAHICEDGLKCRRLEKRASEREFDTVRQRAIKAYKGNCCCPAQIRQIYATSPEYPASAVLARGRRGNARICEDCLKCRRLKKGQRDENSTQFGSGAHLSST